MKPQDPDQDIIGRKRRFEAKVRKSVEFDGCWLWQERVAPGKRPTFMPNPWKCYDAANYSYGLYVEAVNPDAEVRPTMCGNPLCVNPNHLTVVDAGYTEPPTPEPERRHSRQKLSLSDIAAILGDDRSNAEIARQFKVTRQYVKQLKDGLRRKTDEVVVRI